MLRVFLTIAEYVDHFCWVCRADSHYCNVCDDLLDGSGDDYCVEEKDDTFDSISVVFWIN